MPSTYDIAVIGGGINGVGIARDAAGRGLNVLLCEKKDLAAATSSASTKLIHGGLRYLEHYEFRLVRESLSEREVLWSMAPHIVWPLRFVLPHNSSLRPAWLIRLGLFLYDHIGGREKLPKSHGLDLRRDSAGEPLQDDIVKGFEYSDLWVDDARMVVLNAIDAKHRGADIRVGTEVQSAERGEGKWRLNLRDNRSGETSTAEAKVVVNAAGPWASDVLGVGMGINSAGSVRLVKGSHIVVPKVSDDDRAYIFQGGDKRIIFAIPYEHDFSLIGTTDMEFTGSKEDVKITEGEVTYLCESVNEYFKKPISPADVVWTYSGVRPLYNDGKGSAQEVTRDFVLERHGPSDGPATLSVFGGKLTTYRRLAEDVLEKIADCFPNAGPAWTRGAALPGADGFEENGHLAFQGVLKEKFPWLDTKLAARLARSYGVRSEEMLGDSRSIEDMGHHFGADLYEREVDYLMRHEWASRAEDIVWRRSKVGLRMSSEEIDALDTWIGTEKRDAPSIVFQSVQDEDAAAIQGGAQ